MKFAHVELMAIRDALEVVVRNGGGTDLQRVLYVDIKENILGQEESFLARMKDPEQIAINKAFHQYAIDQIADSD
jgi:hypothetical protein